MFFHFVKRQMVMVSLLGVSLPFKKKMRLEDDSSIMVSFLIIISASLLQHLRGTGTGCIPAFQAVFPLPVISQFCGSPCLAPRSSLVCILQRSLEMVITHTLRQT